MATLYISEFGSTTVAGVSGASSQAPTPAPLVPAIAEQALDISGSPNASQSFNPGTTFVMVSTDVPCCLAWGAPAPAASTTYHRMGAGETRFYGVPKGQNFQVSVILTT